MHHTTKMVRKSVAFRNRMAVFHDLGGGIQDASFTTCRRYAAPGKFSTCPRGLHPGLKPKPPLRGWPEAKLADHSSVIFFIWSFPKTMRFMSHLVQHPALVRADS